MSPKISSNMEKALLNRKSRELLDKYLESTERPATEIEVEGKRFRVVSVRQLAEEKKASSNGNGHH